MIDLVDFNILKELFGGSSAPSVGRPILEVLYVPSDSAAVPEPNALMLLGLGGVALLTQLRRNRAQASVV